MRSGVFAVDKKGPDPVFALTPATSSLVIRACSRSAGLFFTLEFDEDLALALRANLEFLVLVVVEAQHERNLAIVAELVLIGRAPKAPVPSPDRSLRGLALDDNWQGSCRLFLVARTLFD